MRLIDTHAHLNDPKFAEDMDEVVARANDAGVEQIIVCGYDLQSSRDAIALADRFGCVYATVGVHPHDAKTYAAAVEEALEEMSAHEKVLAIGEIGLDYHYNFSPREQQLKAFRAQIDLAERLGMPIVVHSRESNDEALEVLTSGAGNTPAGVFHCFSGDEAFAQRVIEAGFYIGVDGPLTYPASEKLRRVVQMCPIDRLLVETDCPYLTPVPHRGKRNEPAYVRFVAEAASMLKGVTLEELADATTRNAEQLFGIRHTTSS